MSFMNIKAIYGQEEGLYSWQ